MTKILTITVPSYHTESYMDACLPTLLDERINDKIEILLVNDGSTDGTLAKAQTYEEKYPDTIKVIDKENGGHGSTINSGVAAATGKYFKVVDGDDWVNTDELVKLVEHLEDLEADIIISPYEDHNMDTNAIQLQSYPVTAEKLQSYDELLEEAGRLPMMHATTFKTSILKEHSIHIDEKMFYVDMEYISFPMPYLETAIYLPYKVYCYRMGTAEQSVNPANFVKNREMHRKVTYQLIRLYNRLASSHPNSVRLKTLEKQLTKTEVALDTNISLFMDDTKQAKQEYLSYQASVKELNAKIWQMASANSKKIRLLSIGNAIFFGILAKYAKKKGIR